MTCATSSTRTCAFNGEGQPASFDLLDACSAAGLPPGLLARGGEEINYRRFFDINELAAIRMEEPAVFEETHRLIFRLVREGARDGLAHRSSRRALRARRVLRQLQRRCFLSAGEGTATLAGRRGGRTRSWRQQSSTSCDRRAAELGPGLAQPFYIVAEKILDARRALSERVGGGRHHWLRVPERRQRASS